MITNIRCRRLSKARLFFFRLPPAMLLAAHVTILRYVFAFRHAATLRRYYAVYHDIDFMLFA